MSRRRVIAVVFLLVLSGCHGLVPSLDGPETGQAPASVGNDHGGQSTANPSGTGDDTVTDTVGRTGTDARTRTTTGTRTETATEPEPDYLAPGLTDEGVLNVSLLLDHHYAILERESGDGTYVAVFRSDRTAVAFPPEAVSASRERYVVEYPRRWYRSRTGIDLTTDETAVSEEWEDESGWLYRIDRPDGSVDRYATNYSTVPGHPGNLDRRLTVIVQSVDLRRSTDVTVEERALDNTTVYAVSDTTRVGSTTTTSTVYIREDGFITRHTARSISNPPSGETTFTAQHLVFEFHTDGTVEPPEWVEEARGIGNETNPNDE